MTIFYDHGAIRITDRSFVVGDRRYDIGQLHNPRSAHGPADRLSRQLALFAGLLLLITVLTAQHLPLLATGTIVATGVVPTAVAAAVRARLRPSMRLLWADYRGSPMQIFQTDDQTEFGKVSRALIRARGHQRAVKYVVLVPEAQLDADVIQRRVRGL